MFSYYLRHICENYILGKPKKFEHIACVANARLEYITYLDFYEGQPASKQGFTFTKIPLSVFQNAFQLYCLQTCLPKRDLLSFHTSIVTAYIENREFFSFFHFLITIFEIYNEI